MYPDNNFELTPRIQLECFVCIRIGTLILIIMNVSNQLVTFVTVTRFIWYYYVLRNLYESLACSLD